jgi:hypothetical protein
MAAAQKVPLRFGATTDDVVRQLVLISAASNSHSEQLDELRAEVLVVAGETAVATKKALEQVQKLTDVVRELRDALLPNAEHRKEMTTLPDIVIEDVRRILNEDELQKRRSESLRAKALVEEDTLARKRDARNARLAVYGLVLVGVVTEVCRWVFTHSF